MGCFRSSPKGEALRICEANTRNPTSSASEFIPLALTRQAELLTLRSRAALDLDAFVLAFAYRSTLSRTTHQSRALHATSLLCQQCMVSFIDAMLIVAYRVRVLELSRHQNDQGASRSFASNVWFLGARMGLCRTQFRMSRNVRWTFRASSGLFEYDVTPHHPPLSTSGTKKRRR